MNIFDELARGVTLPVEADTLALAARFATAIAPDTTVALSGELGAGKTTFVKGLARGLGISQAVTSPSFTVCNFHQGTRLLAHVDAYRLTDESAWDGLMIEDFLTTPWCLVVEWPERIAAKLPDRCLWLRIEPLPDGSRLIREKA